MLAELAALLDLLKAKGVTRARLEPWAYPPSDAFAKCGVIDITFGPEATDIPADEKSEPLDTCKCGHAQAEHQDGLCMHACDEEKCG